MIVTKTNDGVFTIVKKGERPRKVTNGEFPAKVLACILTDLTESEFDYFYQEWDKAMDEMRINNHSAAEFGVCGSFMYTMEDYHAE